MHHPYACYCLVFGYDNYLQGGFYYVWRVHMPHMFFFSVEWPAQEFSMGGDVIIFNK